MLNSTKVNRWEYKILEDVKKSPFLDLSLIILNKESVSSRGFLKKFWNALPRILYALYIRIDERCFPIKENAFEINDATPLTKDIETISVAPVGKKTVHRFEKNDVERLKSKKLDVVIRFGFKIIRGEILNIAKYGIWSFHHDDNQKYRGGPPLFWEIYEGNPVSGTVLQILNEDLDGGKVIYRSFSATHMISYIRNKNPIYWKTSCFILRRLHDLYHRGWDYITGLEPQSTESSYNRGIFKTPKNLQMISFIPRIMGRIFHHKVRSFFFNEKWSIGYKMSSNNPELVFNWEGMHLFQPPKDRFYADPFPIKIKDKYYIFFEEYFFKTKKGVISFVEYLEDGKLTQPKVVLEKKYHLSYPFLFVFEDEIYLLPDTYYNQTVELYKSERFPFQWKKVKVLLANLKATDPTLFFYKNKFWLFTNIEVFGGNELDELFLFYSDSLDGEWIQHPQNPIVSDIRKARPAGKIFKRQGKIIRPSQDCSATYGYRINFNEITYLDEKTYSEKPVQQIAPTWLKKGIGCHTYNEEEGLEVVDGKVMALKTLPIFLSDLRRKK